jgi:hypothetical protein
MAAHFVIGSAEHKELFCRAFIDTHNPFQADDLQWPEVDADALQRLRTMPFWDEAISTESEVATTIQTLAPLVPDPLLREAIALQGYEEGRHAAILKTMIEHYEIPPPALRPAAGNGDPEWAFMRIGYGECFDSFFAFGLYTLARQSGLFPEPLLRVVEPIVQEEARHILFFVNWIAYCRAREPAWKRPAHMARCGMAMAAQVWTRIKTARGIATGSNDGDDFMLGVQDSLDVVPSPGKLLAICLEENERRLADFDPRLLRPRFVPGIARLAAKVLRN